MDEPSRKEGPEIDTDSAFQDRSWKAQRVGWGIMFVAILAALLGLLGGSGPINRNVVGDKSSLIKIEYGRFGRSQTLTQLRVQLAPNALSQEHTRVWLNLDYLESCRLFQVTPLPDHVEIERDRLDYIFRTPDRKRPILITFHLEPNRMGWLEGQLGTDLGPPLVFSQFIYP